MSDVGLEASDTLSRLNDGLLRFAAKPTQEPLIEQAPRTQVLVSSTGDAPTLARAHQEDARGSSGVGAAVLKGRGATWHVETAGGVAWAGFVSLTGRRGHIQANEWVGSSVAPVLRGAGPVLPRLRFMAQPHHLERFAEEADPDSVLDGIGALVAWDLDHSTLDVAPMDLGLWLRTIWEWLRDDDDFVEVTPADEMALSLRRVGDTVEFWRRPDGLPPTVATTTARRARTDILGAMRELATAIERADASMLRTPLFAWLAAALRVS